MLILKEKLLEHDFERCAEDDTFEKHLFDDFTLKISVSEVLEDGALINIYLYSSAFSTFMESVFEDEGVAKSISPRKLKKDREGNLCMVSSQVEISKNKITLILGGEQMEIVTFLSSFSELNSASDFYNRIYVGLNGCFVWFEGVWIFLYLSFLMSLSNTEISKSLSDKKLERIVKKWRLKSEINNGVLFKIRDLVNR